MTPFSPLAAVVLAVFQSGGQVGTKSPPPPSPPLAAATAVAKRTPDAIVIDGRDAEEVWRTAPAFRGFRQMAPVENGDPSVETEFRVAYDDHNFYAFVRAFDPNPDSIKTLLARRDARVCCDQIKLVIDSYHDRRTGFEFAVNPGGVKRDYAVYGDGEQEDDAWDAVWEVETTVDSLGWTAEFRIPLSQLRYPHAETNTFGFGIWRDLDRRGGERVSWPVFYRSRRGFISQLGELQGLQGLAAPTRLELTPYALTKNEPIGYAHTQSFTAGGDIKYGLTSNITVDATVNPDFGQVEADPSVVNLTAFETFYQERRPFFVEGTGIFNFDVNCSIVNCSGENLFYSRRIGHDPARIIGAAKITGRLPSGMTLGAVESITQRVQDGGVVSEPLTNYAALRLNQDFRKGQSGIGFMGTAVNRSDDPATADFFHSQAYVGAVDFRHRFANGMYKVSGSLDYSMVKGTAAKISQTQLNQTHYYQRPDDKVQYDPNRTSLSGSAQELRFDKQNGFITFQTSYQRLSPGFEINDLGFLNEAGLQGWNNWAAMNWTRPALFFQRANWNFNYWQYWSTDGLPTERAVNTNVHTTFSNQWSLHFGGTIAGLGDVYCNNCSRGGPAVRTSRGIYPWAGIVGDFRPPITPLLFMNYWKRDEGRSESFSISPEIDYRIGSQLRGAVVLNATHMINDVQDRNPQTDSATGGTHYVFARIDQQTVSMTFRADYTATSTLTLQVYAQPFVSKGSWSNLRELSATPRAKDYDDRYQPYAGVMPTDFNSKFFNSNVVVRWEYRPGSTLYLVWNQGRQHEEDTVGDRPFTGDFGELFNSRPLNTFLIKVSYWLTPLAN